MLLAHNNGGHSFGTRIISTPRSFQRDVVTSVAEPKHVPPNKISGDISLTIGVCNNLPQGTSLQFPLLKAFSWRVSIRGGAIERVLCGHGFDMAFWGRTPRSLSVLFFIQNRGRILRPSTYHTLDMLSNSHVDSRGVRSLDCACKHPHQHLVSLCHAKADRVCPATQSLPVDGSPSLRNKAKAPTLRTHAPSMPVTAPAWRPRPQRAATLPKCLRPTSALSSKTDSHSLRLMSPKSAPSGTYAPLLGSARFHV